MPDTDRSTSQGPAPSSSQGLLDSSTGGPRPRAWFSRFILISTWTYAVVVLAVLVLIHWVGDAWWGVSVILFLPRWLFVVLVVVLGLASALVRQKSHWVFQLAIGLVVVGPLMGFSLPIQRLWTRSVPGDRFRIVTYNVAHGPRDVEAFTQLLDREHVDFVAFQEIDEAHEFLDAYFAKGWYRDRRHFLASRYPITEEVELPETFHPDGRTSARMTRIRVRTDRGVDLIVASVHLPTLRPGLLRFLDRDVPGLERQIRWWRDELERVVSVLSECGDTPFLVGGDFNMPSDDASMASLRTALRFGFEDSGWGFGYTRPTRYPWFRIDHLMSSPEWSFERCWVGPDFGSDHLPVLA
ncbi:endonuclease/exonuclease/phosphatase family protein, partial [Singulisphaera rosea]